LTICCPEPAIKLFKFGVITCDVTFCVSFPWWSLTRGPVSLHRCSRLFCKLSDLFAVFLNDEHFFSPIWHVSFLKEPFLLVNSHFVSECKFHGRSLFAFHWIEIYENCHIVLLFARFNRSHFD